MIAGPGTLVGLQAALKARLLVIAAGFAQLPLKQQPVQLPQLATEREPNVVDGWLPPKVAGGEERFPFFIVRPGSGFDEPDSGAPLATATFEIIIGTYSDTDDGWLDVLLIIDAIRLSLHAEPVLAGTAYEHVGPLSWELPVEQPRPQWHGVVTTSWTVPRPRRVEARNPAQE